MLSFGDALSQVLESADRRTKSRTSEDVQLIRLEESVGRVAARDYVSDQKIPAFDNSAMDGFAVRSETLATQPVPQRLRVLGTVVAGDLRIARPESTAKEGAWEIMTGAPLPEGYDAVIKIEDVKPIRNAAGNIMEIEIAEIPPTQQYCRAAGEDIQVGTPVLYRGERISPEHLLTLAALGTAEVQVWRKIRMAVISTGKEIVTGQVRNSTAPYLAALMQEHRGSATFFQVGDSAEEFILLFRKILSQDFDLVITTGGVSMGKQDYVADALTELGAYTHFHKIAVRPGKPNLFAEFDPGPVVFALPGNPVSTVVGFRFLVEAWIRRWQGREKEKPFRMQLEEDLKKPAGLQCFFKAEWTGENDEQTQSSFHGKASPRVRILPGQESFRIHPLLEARGWAVLTEAESQIAAGTWIDVYPLQDL